MKVYYSPLEKSSIVYWESGMRAYLGEKGNFGTAWSWCWNIALAPPSVGEKLRGKSRVIWSGTTTKEVGRLKKLGSVNLGEKKS